MKFEVIGKITDVETIAFGNSIREIVRLRKVYGTARWRKLKGIAKIRLADGTICEAARYIGTRRMVLAKKNSNSNIF